jgi:hypothetical protein
MLINLRRVLARIAIAGHQLAELLDHGVGLAGKARLEIGPPAEPAET